MTTRIYIGLSGPTFFDYQNVAKRAANDQGSSPNPILENALGLTVFYDEVWFLCESLCPQTLRGHRKVTYLDKYLSDPANSALADKVAAIIVEPPKIAANSATDLCVGNSDGYWKSVERAGAYWWNTAGRRIDIHTHGLEVLGVETHAISNSLASMSTDIAVCQSLRGVLDLDLSLNSFTKNLYNAAYPNQFDPVVEAGAHAICGSAVINALVPNCITPAGPQPEIFDRISSSMYAAQFRRYIQSKQIDDAYACYAELVRDIESSIVQEVKRAADRARLTRGVTTIIVDAILDGLGIALPAKVLTCYAGSVAPKPITAAAFVLDVRGDA